jgi:hypothetical protein
VSPEQYDYAVEAFCRGLGLRVERVSHLAVGPNYTVARVMDVSTGEEQTVRISREDDFRLVTS